MDGRAAARIHCDPGLVPAAGQYLLAHPPASNAPVAQILFLASAAPLGFVAAPPIPTEWQPGLQLGLRGPLGHGFSLPDSASRIALIAWESDPRRLLPLVIPAPGRDASVALVCKHAPEDLPLQIEVQPYASLLDTLKWADYAAVDSPRESLAAFGRVLRSRDRRVPMPGGQVLVRASMPCGALAECGVCSVRLKKGTALACDSGPVFDLDLLDLESQ